ncbi:BBP7 family outer membrane beta-barrel protein [Planctomycetes bacterium K23_9]|uniref:Uncharacterized protein n=1 Tax=Stieleria marina TaxID=1930275 RepID=A0A517NVT1_9BACT|nr:hypothetical protein K239x_32280 [Planctomycetes bacterium K23_9]
MRTNILRHVAIAMGLSFVATGVQAADYTSPAKWNNFNTKTTQTQPNVFRTVGTGGANCAPCNNGLSGAITGQTIIHPSAPVQSYQSMPAPVMSSPAPIMSAPIVSGQTHSAPVAQGQIISDNLIHQSQPQVVSSTPMTSHVHHGYAPQYSQPQYRGAIGSHIHSGARRARGYGSNLLGSTFARRSSRSSISPWFGGASLLFLDVNENGNGRNFLIDDAVGTRRLNAQDVAPEDNTAFEFNVGRYLAGGLYGLDFRYFQFDPDREQQIFIPATGVTYRPTFTGMSSAAAPLVVSGANPAASVYDYYDGASATPAAGYRISRDLDFRGLEANLVSFGWMGGVRQGQSCNQGLGHGSFANRMGNGRYGGFGGPLTRSGRVQVTTSHGFRWFQLEDALEVASNVDGTAGYQADDVYYNVDTENNLFGYQFGSKLNYCLTERLMLTAGGKIGIYGNDVNVRQRLGTETNLAYYTTAGVDDVLTDNDDTALSALAELDLGLGYRLNNAWTLTGGYRMLSACGVATAPGSTADFTSLDSVGAVNADDCLILHGGYVGLQYNW